MSKIFLKKIVYDKLYRITDALRQFSIKNYVINGVVSSVRYCKKLEWQVWALLAISSMIMMYISFQPLYFGESDSEGYLRFARYMLKQNDGMIFMDRTPGTSIFMIISGVVIFNSWLGLLVLYFAMAVSMPLFIYYSIKYYSNENYAFVAGFITIISGIPFISSHEIIHSDHLTLFFVLLSIYLIARYFSRDETNSLPYKIMLAILASCFVRPVTSLYYWIYLVFALVIKKKDRRKLLYATVIYVLFMGLWSVMERNYSNSIYAPFYRPEGIEERKFAEVYYSGGEYHFVKEIKAVPAIKPEDGYYSKLVYETIKSYIHLNPGKWKETKEIWRPNILFGKYEKDEKVFVDELMSKPNTFYFDFIREAIRDKYGVVDAKKIMNNVAIEHGNTGLRRWVLYFWRNPGKLFIGGETTMTIGSKNILTGFQSIGWRSHGNPRQYSISNNNGRKTMMDAKNGPASKELFNSMTILAEAFPIFWKHFPYYEEFVDSPEEMGRELFSPKKGFPHEGSDGTIFTLLTHYYGYGRAEKLLRNATFEALKANPTTIFIFFDNYLYISLLRYMSDIDDKWNYELIKKWASTQIYKRHNVTSALTSGLKRGIPEWLSEDWLLWPAITNTIFHQLAFPIMVLAVLASGIALIGKARNFVLLLCVTHLYHTGVIAVAATLTGPRHWNTFALFPVMLIVLGCYWGIKLSKITKCRERK